MSVNQAFINLLTRYGQSETLSENDLEELVRFELYEDRDIIKLLLMMRDSSIRVESDNSSSETCRSFFMRDYICKFREHWDDGIGQMTLVIPVAEIYPLIEGERTKYEVVDFRTPERDNTTISEDGYPCPVILFNGKYVCRSRCPSILKVHPNEEKTFENFARSECSMVNLEEKMKRLRFACSDANFLRSIEVTAIYDLSNPNECSFMEDIMQSDMKHIYENIEISNLPYPGREIFENMEYSRQNVKNTTEEYLKIFLRHLTQGEGGILIQSVTGCDRSALFISLLRLSLWADGVIHQHLSITQIALLTLRYDWYQFGYRVNRTKDAEKEMLYFFFTFLPVIATDEFSVTAMLQDYPSHKETMPFRETSSRQKSLQRLSTLFLKFYQKSTLSYKKFTTENPNAVGVELPLFIENKIAF